MATGKAAQDAIKKLTQEGTDAAVVGKTVRSCSEATRVFRSAISVVQALGQQFLYTLAILLVLFIVHQVTIAHNRTAHARGHRCITLCVLRPRAA